MWFKLLAVIYVALALSGCSMTYQNFKDGYKAAKVVYQDVRYVVYEVEEEKERIENGGFGAKSSHQVSEDIN